jgi:hypothetical protein
MGAMRGMGEGFASEIASEPQKVNVLSGPANSPMGQDLYDNQVQYDREIGDYKFTNTNTNKDPDSQTSDPVDYLDQLPYRYPNENSTTCEQQVVASGVKTDPYGVNRTSGRWMEWNENSPPLNCNTTEYKIRPGLYSKYIVQPGYHEGIKTYNTAKTNLLAPPLWPSRNPLDKSYYMLRECFTSESSDTSDASSKDDQQEESQGRSDSSITKMQNSMNEYGAKSSSEDAGVETFENPGDVRISDVLYSGDIINIMSGQTIMQRGTNDSQIIFDKPLDKVQTNLSKVRFVHSTRHDPRKQTAIKYGDAVYLKHNCMVNNKNESRFIKYGEHLQCWQEGPLFRVFKLYNKADAKSQDYVKYGDQIIIAKGDQTGDKIYVAVDAKAPYAVTAEATINDATTFGVTLERVFELHDRNLCICPNDMIYP